VSAQVTTSPRLAQRLHQLLESIPEEQRVAVARRLLSWPAEKMLRFLDDPRTQALMERAPAQRDEPIKYFRTPWALADYIENGAEANPRHLQILDGLAVRGLRQGGVMASVSMHPRSGKAIAIDEPVWTPNGWMAHGDLRVGDQVFAPDGSVTEVIQTHPVDVLPTFRCSTDRAHTAVRASAAHLWWVADRRTGQFEVRRTDEMVRVDRALRLPDQLPLVGRELDLPMDPWMLGYWLGNGTRSHGVVTGHVDDREYVWGRMRALYGVVTESESSQRRRDDGARAFSAASGSLTVDLRAAGVIHEKRIPIEYLLGSPRQRLELLRGIVDSDGYIGVDGQVEVTLMDRRLIDGVVSLLRTLGIRAFGPTERRARLDGRDVGAAWRVTFHHDECAGSPRRRERLARAEAARSAARARTGRYLLVEPTGHAEPVSCITVDRADGAYLVGEGLIPTHNSRRLLRFVPLWLLHQDPSRRIGAFSYNPKIPGDASEYCRDVIERHGPALGLSLSGRNTRLDWRVKGAQDTSYFAGGLKGAATGLGFTDLFIDDPLSGVAEALNAKIKEERYEIIKGNLMTRLQPGGNLYVVGTRWAQDDPIGRIVDDPELGPKFTIIRLAAIAEDNDPLGRVAGEALWPEVWGAEALETRRKMIGEYWFAALYQGRPTPTTGSLFDRGNVRYFLPSLVPGEVELITDHGVRTKRIVLRFTTVDLAIGQKEENDYTCVCTWDVTADADLILRSVLRERFSGPTQGPVIIAEHRAFGGRHNVYVEATQYQLALVQGLQAAGLPAHKVLPKGDKVARSNPAQSLWRQNKVFLPREAPWHDDVLKELGDFNRGEHDDFVDNLSMAALVLMKALRPAEAEEELLQRLIDEFEIDVPDVAA